MARSIRHGAPFVFAAFVWASPGFAQQSAVAKAPLQINPPGSYEGVKPGGNEPPPVRATPNSSTTLITWPGFQMRPDGGSRVFIQSTAPLSHSVSQKGNLLLIDLGSAKVSGETNQFALYTRFFNTPVVRAQLKPGARATLEIELRASVQPSISSEQAASGFHFLYIDFPAGQYLAKGPVAAAPAPTAAPAPAAGPGAPAHLDDGPPAPPEPASGGVKANASIDTETPPGQVKTKAKAGFKL
jgi:hypothetical protein